MLAGMIAAVLRPHSRIANTERLLVDDVVRNAALPRHALQ
jgi:hypothetical protein